MRRSYTPVPQTYCIICFTIQIFNQLSMIDSVICWIRCPLWTECWRFGMNTSGPSALDLWYDRIRLFGSNGKGYRPAPVLLFAFSVWPVATDVLVAFWFFLSPGSALKVKVNFKVEKQTCWQKSFTKPSIHQSPHQRNVWRVPACRGRCSVSCFHSASAGCCSSWLFLAITWRLLSVC